MILSTGKSAELKILDDKTLQSEERIFYNRYKTAYRNTISKNQPQAFENEIVAFNRWRDLYDERVRRDEMKRG